MMVLVGNNFVNEPKLCRHLPINAAQKYYLRPSLDPDLSSQLNISLRIGILLC